MTSVNHYLQNGHAGTNGYNFRDVQADIHVVASLDESTYNGGNMGGQTPNHLVS